MPMRMAMAMRTLRGECAAFLHREKPCRELCFWQRQQWTVRLLALAC